VEETVCPCGSQPTLMKRRDKGKEEMEGRRGTEKKRRRNEQSIQSQYTSMRQSPAGKAVGIEEEAIYHTRTIMVHRHRKRP